MLYLFEENMIKTVRTLKNVEVRQETPHARRRASFFCIPALALLVCASFFAVACGTTAAAGKKADAPPSPVSPEPLVDQAPVPVTITAEPPHSETNQADTRTDILACESLEVDLKRARAGNTVLSEENGRLRSEALRLNTELAEANLKIYSLNQKLEAIFKPEAGGS